MTEKQYKYDVALSFLQCDEDLASSLNDLLKANFETFFYSEKQKELAGRDGEEKFSRAFGEEARIVVIFYREGWGTTPWTRIEETAIKNRAYDEGYDFTFFVAVEPKAQMPRWLKRTMLWFGMERWGLEGAAAAIESKIQEHGGEAHEETIEQRTKRQQEEIRLEQARKQFLNSEAGVMAAKAEVNNLYSIIEGRASQLAFDIQTQRVGNTDFDMQCERISAGFDWRYNYANSLERSSLMVRLWKGPPPRAGRMFIGEKHPLATKKYYFDRGWDNNYGWNKSPSSNERITTEKLVDECLKFLLDKVHSEAMKKRD